MLGWAIVRCPSRSELLTSWPEAEAQRDLRRRSVIKCQVIRLKTHLVLYRRNFLLKIHIHIVLAVRLQSSGQACEKYAEDHGFESMYALFLFDFEIRTYWFVPVRSSMYQYVLNQ